MDLPNLSTLLPVDVRLVWPGEASSFTPWLLANPDVLGKVLGMDLELTAAEHKVGGFSLDLIGRDASEDQVVIIENQFGPTDHRHLGQLLTYAGGTDPKTVVWIAESFRDEHRAALDWLNLRTDSATRFFGVRLGTVTLAGAPAGLVAPLLEVVVQPNDWGKAVKKSPVDAQSDKQQLYSAFWTKWLERTKHHCWTNRKAPDVNWMYLPSGSPRARYMVCFRSDGLLSELFFHHEIPEINVARWRVLEAKRPLIEESFGEGLIFDDLPERKGCRIGIMRQAGESVDEESAWPNYLAWFEDTQVRLRAAIAAAGGIPPIDDVMLTDERDNTLGANPGSQMTATCRGSEDQRPTAS